MVGVVSVERLQARQVDDRVDAAVKLRVERLRLKVALVAAGVDGEIFTERRQDRGDSFQQGPDRKRHLVARDEADAAGLAAEHGSGMKIRPETDLRRLAANPVIEGAAQLRLLPRTAERRETVEGETSQSLANSRIFIRDIHAWGSGLNH